MDERNCGYCRPCADGRYDDCATFPRATPAPGAPAEPTEAMVLAMVRRMFSERNYAAPWEDVMRLAYMDAIAAAPGAPGQEAAAVDKDSLTTQAAAVQAVGQEALTWCAAALQAAIPFDERDSSIRRFDTGDVKTIDEILDLANAALPPSGAGEKTS